MNGRQETTVDAKVHEAQDKAMREIKAKRHLAEMELHTTMQLTNQVSIMKVIGGLIYYNHLEKWACFVPERRV